MKKHKEMQQSNKRGKITAQVQTHTVHCSLYYTCPTCTYYFSSHPPLSCVVAESFDLFPDIDGNIKKRFCDNRCCWSLYISVKLHIVSKVFLQYYYFTLYTLLSYITFYYILIFASSELL